MKAGGNKKSGEPLTATEQYRSVNVEISTTHNPELKSLVVPQYSEEEHGTWAIMFDRQMKAFPGRASQEYLDALKILNLPKDRIPKLIDVSAAIEKATGWRLTRVAGLVPEKEFFECLSQKLFPCTDFIRKRDELEYTPSPDMFHDILGHIPLITNPEFAHFYEFFGKTALKANAEMLAKLQKIYWFTVEFGLIKNPEGTRIYGSGILSSIGEVMYCLGPQVRVHTFDYEVVEKQYYEIFHMQEDLYVIESFDWLLESFKNYAKKNKLIP